MSITLKSKDVKIKKEHLCFLCGRTFPVGSIMNYWAGVCDNNFGACYACPTCKEIIKIIPADDDGYPEGFVEEFLDENQTPEQFLETLIND